MSRTDLGSEARRDIAGGSPRTVICQINDFMVPRFHGFLVVRPQGSGTYTLAARMILPRIVAM